MITSDDGAPTRACRHERSRLPEERDICAAPDTSTGSSSLTVLNSSALACRSGFTHPITATTAVNIPPIHVQRMPVMVR